MEHFSAGALLGGLHYWESRMICKELWRWASLSMGALLGNLEWGSFTRDTPFQQLRRTVITINIPTTRIAYTVLLFSGVIYSDQLCILCTW
jgi:hypothetical protein